VDIAIAQNPIIKIMTHERSFTGRYRYYLKVSKSKTYSGEAPGFVFTVKVAISIFPSGQCNEIVCDPAARALKFPPLPQASQMLNADEEMLNRDAPSTLKH
jgi:hypothetical protein